MISRHFVMAVVVCFCLPNLTALKTIQTSLKNSKCGFSKCKSNKLWLWLVFSYLQEIRTTTSSEDLFVLASSHTESAV